MLPMYAVVHILLRQSTKSSHTCQKRLWRSSRRGRVSMLCQTQALIHPSQLETMASLLV